MQRYRVGLRKQFFLADAFDIGRKIAVDDVGITGDHTLETVAADVRHALADAAEAQNADGHVGNALHLAGAREMPFPGLDVPIVERDVPQQRQRHRQRVGGHLADAVIGRVADPHAMRFRIGGIDGVEAGAVPADNPDLGAGREYLGIDRRVLHQQTLAAFRGGNHLVLGAALRNYHLDAGSAIQRLLQFKIGKVIVSDQDLHFSRFSGCLSARKRRAGRPGNQDQRLRRPAAHDRHRASSSPTTTAAQEPSSWPDAERVPRR